MSVDTPAKLREALETWARDESFWGVRRWYALNQATQLADFNRNELADMILNDDMPMMPDDDEDGRRMLIDDITSNFEIDEPDGELIQSYYDEMAKHVKRALEEARQG